VGREGWALRRRNGEAGLCKSGKKRADQHRIICQYTVGAVLYWNKRDAESGYAGFREAKHPGACH
jgi:hypothetical protein